MEKMWTEQHKQFIRDHAHELTDEQMAKELSVLAGRKITLHAVRKQRRALGIKKVGGRGIFKTYVMGQSNKN